VLVLLAGEARRGGVSLRLEIDDGDHVIDADADRLQQVVLNLVKNALAATPQGGSIVVRVEATADVVRLVVTDTGPGIAVEMQTRLFEPFFTTRASQGGTGLGLAVVRAIAVEHGGSVAVRSEPGRGAEFVASFPRPPELVHV
jgi:signal transduction histidine kinase